MKKRIRVTISVIIFSLLTFYFLDFADILPLKTHILTHIQFIPALLAVNAGFLIFITLLTLVFGRIYCSSVCPLGIFQDIVNRISKQFNRKKKYPYYKANNKLRWIIVALLIVLFFAGGNVFISILDPYSAYGRMATHILKPIYVLLNNGIAFVSNHFHYYNFYPVEIIFKGMAAFVIALVTFFVIGFISYKYGRLYCNTICPVGTILGFFARFSLFKIKLGGPNCNSCGLCEMKCKASCINAANKEIDYSRCVSCFNCLEVCHRESLSWGFSFKKKPQQKPITPVTEAYKNVDIDRRKLISTLLGIGLLPKIFARKDTTEKVKEIFTLHNVAIKKKHAVTPPGSVDVKRFNEYCTACHLCVSKCPSQVLKPAFLEYGLIGIMQPSMNFEHGYCNYHCTLCTEICPAKALVNITEKEKKNLQIGQVQYVKENCVVVTDGTDCGACSEHCPTQAVSMQPYKGDLRIPTINHDLCVGCGACEYICPVRPFRAIYVEGNPTHLQAKVVEEKEQKIEVKDFGF
jgi:polyferredoxin